MAVTIEIPCMPPRECGPNWHGHWRQRARAASEFRDVARWSTQAAAHVGHWLWWDKVPDPAIMDVRVEWCCRRKVMDDDNLIAALKPARDGIADVLFGGSDERVRVGTVEQVRGSGRVIVTLREG